MRVSAMSSRLAGAVLASLLICAPPPASARGGWDDDRDGGHRHSRGHHRHHDRQHEHGRWCAPRHGYPQGYGHNDGRGWYGPPRHVSRARYYCDPCGGWYDDEAAFHRHIRHRHHIAEAVIPFVLGAAVFGWVFSGH